MQPIMIAPNGMVGVEQIKRDDHYYLTGGDIIFLAGSKLFRVHRFFFERESLYFRSLLDIPDPMPAGQVHKGMADTNPIGLDGVDETDFAKFLWVFYNPSYSEWTAPLSTWAPITRLAHIWGFANVKALCVRQLETLTIPHIDKIVLYRDNALDQKLLVPAFAALCEREVAVSVEEGRRLGLELSLGLMQARERARVMGGGGSKASSPVSLKNEDLDQMIVQVLRLDEPISEETGNLAAANGSGQPTTNHKTPPAGGADGTTTDPAKANGSNGPKNPYNTARKNGIGAGARRD